MLSHIRRGIDSGVWSVTKSRPFRGHAMLYNPETARCYLSGASSNGGFHEGKPVALLVWKLTRLNHFSFRLRPVALRTPCLTFRVTSTCPMLATRWLTYLAGTRFSPAGMIDLARPHSPLVFETLLLTFCYKPRRTVLQAGPAPASLFTSLIHGVKC